jgi:hypothetical protein
MSKCSGVLLRVEELGVDGAAWCCCEQGAAKVAAAAEVAAVRKCAEARVRSS